MAGRIGSTRPIPMKETTHAKATAKTAFGCRKGLATVPLILCTIQPAGMLRRRFCPGRKRRRSGCRRRKLVVAPEARQRVYRGQRGCQRVLLVRTEPGQQHGQPLRPGGAAARHYVTALLGDLDIDHPAVIWVRGSGYQASLSKPADELRHGRLSDSLTGGKRSESARSGALERAQRGASIKREPRRAQPTHQGEEPLESRGYLARCGLGATGGLEFHNVLILRPYVVPRQKRYACR